jgi:hypothetical protein
MNAARVNGWLIALLFTAGMLTLRASESSAQAAPKPVSPTTIVNPGPHHEPATNPAGQTAEADRKAQIKAIDEKIKSLRDEFKSQADPLQSQLKSLRDKLDADLKPLEDQRKALVEQGESPELIALNQEEADQLTALAEKEKVEIEKLKQSYEGQKKDILANFQNRRQALKKK